jgi:hypothetical protein
MTNPDLHLDSARTTSRSLADRHGHTITNLVELLGLDRKLIEDLELGLNRSAHLVEAPMVAAEQRLLGLKPLEVL